MRLRIQTIKLGSGSPLPMLLDDNGVPLIAPLIYNLTMVRGAGRRFNTQQNILRTIRKVEKWSMSEFGRRIEIAIQNHEDFDHIRIASLRGYLEIPENIRTTKETNVTGFRNSELLRKSSFPPKRVNAGQTTRQYLLDASGYIQWLMNEHKHSRRYQIHQNRR